MECNKWASTTKAEVEPFGRPFLAHLTNTIAGTLDDEPILLNSLTRLSLEIWDYILRRNKGVSMDFILGRLPAAKSNIFADASTEWGIGGCCGEYYFKMP